jgi:hypothetical protein
MFSITLRGVLASGLVLVAADLAHAQDFKVYTPIFDLAAKGGGNRGSQASPVSRTTTMFQAGKVFDRPGGGNQTTIYEPAEQRFMVLDGARRVATIYSFDAIREVLDRQIRIGEKKIAELRRSADQRDLELAEQIEFQLHPRFEERYGESQRELTLSSPWLSYTVRCEPADASRRVEAYLDYADRAAELNFIVNRQSPFPAARQQLNAALRRRKLLPVEVRLNEPQRDGMHLKATHRFDWTLGETDRQLIRDCEKLLHTPDVKPINFDPARVERASVKR